MGVLSLPADTRPLWKRIVYWTLFIYSSLILAASVIITAILFLGIDWLLGVGALCLTIIPASSTLFFYIVLSYRPKTD